MKIVGEGFAGVGTAATRVVESYQPKALRLFDDPLALKLLPWGWRVVLRLAYLPGLRERILSLRERRMPGSLGAILCRTCYIDDVLKQSLAEGLDQVVILGAGFDTRAYRIAGIEAVQVFEVDLPGSQALKQKRVGKVLGAVPKHVAMIGMDFDHDNLEDALVGAGFKRGVRTFFIWEGVTQYITAQAVSTTLETVSRISGAGSAVLFTYVPLGLIDGTDRPEWMEPFLAFAERIGSPFIHGMDGDELASYLARRDLKLVEDVGAADFRERYLQPLGRALEVFDAERIAFARKNEAGKG